MQKAWIHLLSNLLGIAIFPSDVTKEVIKDGNVMPSQTVKNIFGQIFFQFSIVVVLKFYSEFCTLYKLTNNKNFNNNTVSKKQNVIINYGICRRRSDRYSIGTIQRTQHPQHLDFQYTRFYDAFSCNMCQGISRVGKEFFLRDSSP